MLEKEGEHLELIRINGDVQRRHPLSIGNTEQRRYACSLCIIYTNKPSKRILNSWDCLPCCVLLRSDATPEDNNMFYIEAVFRGVV